MNILYPAKITHENNRYTVKFFDLEEAITEGETLEEALFQAADVLTLTLEGRIDEGLEIPLPSVKPENAHLIAPSARVQAALLVRFAKKDHTTSELARTLETSWASVSRLEDPHHWPSLRQLERAAAALGQRLIISLEPASSQS